MSAQRESNRIIYGPHSFYGLVERYIKSEVKHDLWNDIKCHQNIKETLAFAFSNIVEDSILSQLGMLGYDSTNDVSLSFANYGDTQLVYLAVMGDKSRFAVLINQPHTKLGVVKKEFDNLQRLFALDSHFVVEPCAYFGLPEKGHELYVTKYIDDVMCIAAQAKQQGAYLPSPKYHFEQFSHDVAVAVNSSIISLLVNYYDEENKAGISKTQIGGNDFMLLKDFDKNDVNTVAANIKLGAAREFITASFDEYLDILRNEFVIATTRDCFDVRSGKLKVNYHSKASMTPTEIEKGIALGLKLREQRRGS